MGEVENEKNLGDCEDTNNEENINNQDLDSENNSSDDNFDENWEQQRTKLEMNAFNNSFENMQTQEMSLKLLICFSSFLTFRKQMFISAYIPTLNCRIFLATHLINILFDNFYSLFHALSDELLCFALTRKRF